MVNNSKAYPTFYIIIGKDVKINGKLAISCNLFLDQKKLNTVNITIDNVYDSAYLLNDYIHNTEVRLDNVSSVESKNNLLTLYGFKNRVGTTRKIQLKQGEFFSVRDRKYLTTFSGFNFIDAFSIFSVPYKVRPGLNTTIASRDTTFQRVASSGITNLGLNLDVAKITVDRYFPNGKKSTHKFSSGIFAAPSVEELDSIYTKGYLKKTVKSKQLFVSWGITLSYSYNDVSFVFVPFGWDIGTSTIGKNWVYSGKRWWGFGLGISPKIFSSILNK